MKEDRLDKSLRNKLTGYASPLETESAWQALSAQRKQSRRKRRIFLLFCLLGFASLCSIGIYWHLGTPSSTQMSVLSQESVITSNSKNQASVDTPSKNEFTKLKKQERLAAGNFKPLVEPSRSAFPPATSIQKKQKTTTTKTATPTTRKPAMPLATNNNPLLSTELQSNFSKPSETNSTIPQSKALSPIPMLPLLSSQAEGNSNALALAPSGGYSKASRWWLGVQGGMEKRWLQIDLESPLMDAYAEQRSVAEEGLDQWWAGLQVRYQLTPRWFLESGGQYRQTTNRFTDSYQLVYTEIESNQVVQIINRQDGTVEEVMGALEVEVTENGARTIYNRSNQWTLPLYVGYQFHRQDRFGMSLVVGPELTYLSSLSGQTYQDAQTSETLIPLSQLPYKNTFWQAMTRLELHFELDKATQINFGLQGRFGLGSMLKSDAGYRERQQSIGVMIGLSRRL